MHPMCTDLPAVTRIDAVMRRQRLVAPRRSRLTRRQVKPATPSATATPGLLQLIWLASPALPVGGFSYSEGLEPSVESALVATESEAESWLVNQLHLTLARGDLAVVGSVVEAWRRADTKRVRELNDWVLQTRESSEFRLQTEQMGRSLVEWLRNQDAGDPVQLAQDAALAAMDPTYPVAFALAASRTEASLHDILQAFAFGWAENMVQAAVKAVPLGQNAGQRILARLANEIPAAAELALQLADIERQAFSPMLAILSAQHEAQYSRLFRS